jgi:ABC-type sugar transport system ATPase subunit
MLVNPCIGTAGVAIIYISRRLEEMFRIADGAIIQMSSGRNSRHSLRVLESPQEGN